MKTIVLDIGGTLIKVGIFYDDNLLEYSSYPTFNKEKSINDFKNNLITIIKKYEEIYKLFNEIRISIPGPFINKEEGILGNLSNLPLNNFNIKQFLKKEFKKSAILIENDANCFAFGEYFYEIKNNNNIKNKKINTLVGITIGTGLGIGIIIDKKIYFGKGNSGEIAHLPYKKKELEDFVSIKGLKKILFNLNYKIKNFEELNSEKYNKVWKLFSEDLSYAIQIIIYMLDPDIIVLGGGVSNSYEYFEKYLIENLKKNIKVKLPHIRKKNNLSNIFGAFYIGKKIEEVI